MFFFIHKETIITSVIIIKFWKYFIRINKINVLKENFELLKDWSQISVPTKMCKSNLRNKAPKNIFFHWILWKLLTLLRLGSVVGIRPIVRMWDLGLRGSALREGLSKESNPVFTRVSENIPENSKRLGRQVRPRIEPGTFRLPDQAQNRSVTCGALTGR